MKKVPLYVKRIEISSNIAEELENLTDPNLHNTPIDNLWLLLDSFKISSKTIENLKAINPNSITIRLHHKFQNEDLKQIFTWNFIKLLSKLDNISLEMEFEQDHYYKFKLEFNDAIWKVVESKEECSYIRAKSVEIRCKVEELYWIK